MDKDYNVPLTCCSSTHPSPTPDWSNRKFDTIEGWINELGTLSEHPNAMPFWVRSAIKTIYISMMELSTKQ